MDRTVGPIRLLLAVMFLLARTALGFAASIQPCPATAHVQAALHVGADHVAAASPGQRMKNAPCRADHTMPCCCGSGLCGTALGVLPPPAAQDLLPVSTLAFMPDGDTGMAGIQASPALPPPRI